MMQRSKAFSVVRAAARFKVAFTLREGGKYADELDGASDGGAAGQSTLNHCRCRVLSVGKNICLALQGVT